MNFYGYGHGAAKVVSDGVGGTGCSSTEAFLGIPIRDYADALKGRRYRFAFLDGCRTADTQVLRAFGASSLELPFGMYPPLMETWLLDITSYSEELPPAAFLAWYMDTGYATFEPFPIGWQYNMPRAFFTGQIAANWTIGRGQGPMTILESLQRARRDTIEIFGTSYLRDKNVDVEYLLLFGCKDLKYKSYNRAEDTLP